jgi:hypothetical protein
MAKVQERYFAEKLGNVWFVKDREQDNCVVARQIGGKRPDRIVNELNEKGWVEVDA